MGRLFKNVFERRTSTGSELFSSFLKDALTGHQICMHGQASLLL